MSAFSLEEQQSLVAAQYHEFLREKIKLAPRCGFDVPLYQINPHLKPHTRDIARWALSGGQRAIFASFGLHKTATNLEVMRLIGANRPGLRRLIIMPLGVRQEFAREVRQRFTGEYAVELKFIKTSAEVDRDDVIYVTNYEPVRDGKIDPSLFGAVALDEAAVLRSYGSKTFQEFLDIFAHAEFKFVYTATPSPNRLKELIHYAGFLGVMDTGQALTRFFQRDSEKAGNLTLYPHKEREFWLWVASWALYLQKPSDLGHSDEGYVLPPLNLQVHELPSNYQAAGNEKNGQGLLIPNVAMGLSAAAGEKRESLADRVAKVVQLLRARPAGAQAIVWCDLNDEQRALERAIAAEGWSVASLDGSQDQDLREELMDDWRERRRDIFLSKPVMYGAGPNLQQCQLMIFAGIGFKFADFIQAVHRILRFGQQGTCSVHLIHTEVERAVLATLMEKWRLHDDSVATMGEIIRTYGLDQLQMQDTLARTIGVERQVAEGEHFRVANNDCVLEALQQPDNSMGMILTSIPFGNQYEYSPSYNDFGHTVDNDQFWRQMDFLTPQLLRILQPGRIYACHVKDRILFGNVTGAGVPTVSPFHAEAIFHARRHGFDYMGMITIVTDVVRENNQTYRLGYSEVCKDGTKMGVGMPEYVLLFHKPQTDRSKSYADTPATKAKPLCMDEQGAAVPFDRKLPPIPGTGYSVARWQVDAHAFWRSSGDRLVGAAEMASYGPGKLAKYFTESSLQNVYDYEFHVAVGERMLAEKTLPATFMSLAPGSHDPMVWHDIVRMKTLNGDQSARAVENHVCPFQIDIVDRLINRYTNPGETVYDPFHGLGTVGVRAVKLGRRGAGSELNTSYFRDQVHYLQLAEREVSMPTLFDLAALDVENEK
ncbi:DNA methyltransferase [Duganella callida]|uniref:DNA methylase N-4 n=1 Tax=Duganella callida TaxID=2561932 RepID=A0A4Y9S362_9BURK|nr:DNA methyltransferase [Duganella callida]TFW15945.1 DNA methylase N-4 [Duganella callida]